VLEDPIPDDAVEEKQSGQPGPRYRLRPGLTAAEAIERYATPGPDGVRFLQFGKLHGHVAPYVRSQFAFRGILDELPRLGWIYFVAGKSLGRPPALIVAGRGGQARPTGIDLAPGATFYGPL